MFLPVSEKYYDEFDSITIKKYSCCALRVTGYGLRGFFIHPAPRNSQPATLDGPEDYLIPINLRVYPATVHDITL